MLPLRHRPQVRNKRGLQYRAQLVSMDVGAARAARESSSSDECAAAKAAGAAKLPASHFVSLRITNPAFLKRAEDGERTQGTRRRKISECDVL